MDHSFWDDVQTIYAAVEALPSEDRRRLLAERCGNRADLRAEIESLLASRDRAGAFLEIDDGGEREPRPNPGPDLPLVAGFRLGEQIGRGGMGAVYRSERVDGEFTQQVAIKLIDAPMHDPEALRRFRAERQILAALNHPHIVTLLDAGLTTTGQAYLTMKYVEGVPITRSCVDRALSLESRLQLIIAVCGAVQYAHQKFVVHRDLKPGNILVTPQGVPMVLDFGVAKLLDASSTGIDRTATGLQQPLTPSYASPEQLRGLPATTASDIYALGVLLYEVLTNARPFETAGQPLDRVFDLVLKTDPVRPSAVLLRSPATFPYESRRLRGDLDAIVLKAMRKEPEARYTSAEALADDVTRFLAGRPVFARDHSTGYLLRKVAARHKGAVVIGGLAAVGLVTALTVTIWQWRVADQERLRAEQRLNEVHQLANALVFKLHEAVIAVPGATKARRVIVDEARVYLERLAREAPGRDRLQIDLARTYRELGSILGSPGIPNLGDTEGALDSYARGLALVRPLAERRNPPPSALAEYAYGHLRISHTLASVAGRQSDSERAAREALAAAERLFAAAPEQEEAVLLMGDANAVLADALGASPASLGYLRASLPYIEAWRTSHPGDANGTQTLALHEWWLAHHLDAHLDPQGARPHFLRARELFESLVASGKETRLGAQARASCYIGIREAALAVGDLAAARRAAEESLRIMMEIAEIDSANVYARTRLANIHAEIAEVLEAAGETRGMHDHLTRALSLYRTFQPQTKQLQLLGDTHLRLGRLALAAGDTREGCDSLARASAAYQDADANSRWSPRARQRWQDAAPLRAQCQNR